MSTFPLTRLHLASLWKTLRHRSANASSEEGRVESFPHLQPPDRICSTTSHAQDETQEKIRVRQKAIERFMLIEFMSETWHVQGLVVFLRNNMRVDMARAIEAIRRGGEEVSSFLVSIVAHLLSLGPGRNQGLSPA